jgi:hypothetical protein
MRIAFNPEVHVLERPEKYGPKNPEWVLDVHEVKGCYPARFENASHLADRLRIIWDMLKSPYTVNDLEGFFFKREVEGIRD